MSTAVQLLKPATSLPGPVEWSAIKDQAVTLLKSKFLPNAITTPEQAIAIAIKGRELGVPMMQAFSHIHIIQGKPTISSELMLSLIYRNVSGAMISYDRNDDKSCVISASRGRGQPQSKFSFTIEDAKRAGVTGKDNWAKYPSAMLRARCISAMARAVFPDAIMGCSYVPEELGANVDEEGRVIDVPPSVKVVEVENSHEPVEGLFGYVVTFGKYKGQMLGDIPMEDLNNYVSYIENKARQDNKQITGQVAEFIRAVNGLVEETGYQGK